MIAFEAQGVGRNNGKAALGLVMTAFSQEKLDDELRQAKAAILDWQNKHGEACGNLMFTVTVPPALRQGTTEMLDKVYREEENLAPLLQRLIVNVALLNEKGKPACQYRLGHEQPEFKTQADKPWWKFW